jgi:hypothetical protein
VTFIISSTNRYRGLSQRNLLLAVIELIDSGEPVKIIVVPQEAELADRRSTAT